MNSSTIAVRWRVVTWRTFCHCSTHISSFICWTQYLLSLPSTDLIAQLHHISVVLRTFVQQDRVDCFLWQEHLSLASKRCSRAKGLVGTSWRMRMEWKLVVTGFTTIGMTCWEAMFLEFESIYKGPILSNVLKQSNEELVAGYFLGWVILSVEFLVVKSSLYFNYRLLWSLLFPLTCCIF